MNQHFDVLIIGGGPAGASCALALRNSGLKVAIVDKGIFPRDKTCGDAIPGPSLKILRKILGTHALDLSAFHQKTHVRTSSIYPQSGKRIDIHWKAEAYNAKRIDFDDFLFNLVKQDAQTKIFEGLTIQSLTRSDVITCKIKDSEDTFSADVVVGADGANSVVYRTFFKEDKTPASDGFAVRAYYTNVDCPAHTNAFFLLNSIRGYFWIFPLGNNQFNVGIGFMKRDKSNQKLNIKKTFEEIIHSNEVIAPKFIKSTKASDILGFKLPLGGRPRRISQERVVLTGDAAHLIDPLQGHGIDKAMESGRLAAIHIKNCFETKQFSAEFMSKYDDEVNQTIGQDLRRNQKVMSMLYRFPWLFPLLSRAVHIFRPIILRIFYRSKRQQ
ncbi:MAG: geranylgeranyl reductase family protein [Bacteroidia bacterium]|jgi:geranylgeranyl reductase family protein